MPGSEPTGGRHPILARIFRYLLLPIAAASALAFHWFLYRSVPVTTGLVAVDGLREPAEIVRDDHGLVAISAATEADAYFAVGFAHAQDRLWQMMVQRQTGRGRLSEVVGRSALQTDKLMRALDLASNSRATFEGLSDHAKAGLRSYAGGVNAWLSSDRPLPAEFLALRFHPEPWRPEDSILLLKLTALAFATNYTEELALDVVVASIGAGRASALIEGYANAGPVVTAARFSGRDDSVAQGLLALSRTITGRRPGDAFGSNAWVVSGARTASGKPILANDTHTPTQIPAMWYLASIRAGDLDVVGATLPGLPVVIAGRNRQVGWGVTALPADTQDLFVERTHLRDRNLYEVDGAWLPMEVREERIRVAADFPEALRTPIAPVAWAARRTVNGPVVSDAIGDSKTPITLRWAALEPGDSTYDAFLRLNSARSWSDFRDALSGLVAPALSFVYADVEGNIGFLAAGRIPIRTKGDGLLPRPGWETAFRWNGYVPADELPRSLNPERGSIVTANNRIHGDDYPHFISRGWAPGYRAERILELLADAGRDRIGVRDMARMQGDVTNLQAREARDLILAIEPETPLEREAVERIRAWDFRMDEASSAAAIYFAWRSHFNRMVIADDLGAAVLPETDRERLDAIAGLVNPLFIARLARGTDTSWCDDVRTTEQETCADVSHAALAKALAELRLYGGGDPDGWQWGALHRAHYPHTLFTRVRLLDRVFDRYRANGGDDFTVNVGATVFARERGYLQTTSPSFRQILDMADWDGTLLALNTGQSGNFLSSHYDDLLDLHRELGYLDLSGVRAGSPSGRHLRLAPRRASGGQAE